MLKVCVRSFISDTENWTKIFLPRAQERVSERASEASKAEEVNERAVRANEPVNKRLIHD